MMIMVPALQAISFAANSLPVPEGFSVEMGSSYVLIHVEPAEKGQYIRIEKSTDDGEFKLITSLSSGRTSYKDYNVSNGHIYKYRARRYNSKDSSPYTQEIEVIYVFPDSFSITRAYSNQINLEWSYPEVSVPGTIPVETVIERKIGNSRWEEIYTAPFHQREYMDYGLDPDTVYYYRIRTKYPGGQYSKYVPSSAGISTRTTVPSAAALTGYAVTNTSIRLDWDREEIEGYTVSLQRLDSFGEFETIFSSSSADYYIDRNLTPNSEYTYRLAIRSSKSSVFSYSEEITVKTETIPSPSQLTASPAALGRITLTWEFPYDVESGFEIWRKVEGKAWELIDTVPRNTTDWTDYSAHTNKIYRYRVRAIRGESVYSGFAVTDRVNNAEPPMPGELLFLPLDNYMLIGTDEPAPEGVTYTLEMRTDINEPWMDYTFGQKGSALLVYFFPTVGKEYDFRIRSENKGNTVYGPVYHLPGTVPEAPANLRVAFSGPNHVLLAWNDVSTAEDGFRIYRIHDQKRTLIGTTVRNATSFTDTAAIPGATVSYEVCAFNLRGESASRSVQVSIPQDSVFKDLEAFPWCVDAVNALAASGVIARNPDGLFHPGVNITRAEFITLLLKVYGIVPESEFLFSLKDVTPSHWYYPYMMTAVKMGIVIPDENRYSGALNPITKAEMAVCINRLLAARNRMLYPVSVAYLDRFTDGQLVPEDLKGIISSLAADGIMPAQDGYTLNLSQPATRAEAAVILYRFSMRYHR